MLKLVAIDLQRGFTDNTKGESVNFIINTLFPFLKENNLKVAEVVSDYRLDRLGHKSETTNPNNNSYDSLIPRELVRGKTWIKAMHSPLWIRENGGVKGLTPGTPYQDTVLFNKWVSETFGESEENIPVVFGLTMEICVHLFVQELYHLGYKPLVIYEAVDPMNERLLYKEEIAKHTSLSLYSKVISFKEFKEMVKSDK